MNRKGDLQMTSVIPIILFIFAVFFFLIFYGITIAGFSLVNDALSQDVDVGASNLADVNDLTFGAITEALLNSADTIGIMIIFSMIVFMIFSAYFFGNNNKLWIPVDILILLFVYIIAVYISNSYETIIHVGSVFDVYIDTLPKSSSFMLNLPMYVPIIGALIMIVTYTRIGRDDDQGVPNVLGY